MDNIQEREQPKPERAVSLDQDFDLFDPRYTEKNRGRYEVDRFDSSIKLNIDNLQINFNIDAHVFRANSKGYTITPFDPELGYQINSEDYNIESRKQKMEREKKEFNKQVDFSKAPLTLQLMSKENQSNEEVIGNQENSGLLKKLRLVILFPEEKDSYEARAHELSLELHNKIELISFYPQSKPLPYKGIGPQFLEGFKIALPSDPEKLSQIRARFLLAEEETEEIQA